MKLLIGNGVFENLVYFVIIAFLVTWITTQGFKVLLKLYVGEKFKISMLFVADDFPSTHTAVVINNLCLVIFITFYGKNKEIDIWRACCDIRDLLIMLTITGISIKDSIGRRHRQDITNKNLKNLKDLIVNSGSIKADTVTILENKTSVADVINDVFSSIDNEAFKRVGHLKHELIGGILSGLLGALYTICIFFGYYKILPILILISLIYFFGMGTFLKLKPIIERLYTNFK